MNRLERSWRKSRTGKWRAGVLSSDRAIHGMAHGRCGPYTFMSGERMSTSVEAARQRALLCGANQVRGEAASKAQRDMHEADQDGHFDERADYGGESHAGLDAEDRDGHGDGEF